MKKIILLLSVIFISLSSQAQKKEKTYKVLAACGTCNFDMQNKNGCTLAIQIAGKHYWVEGSTLADHGDEHGEGGMCNTIRKAKVVGKLENDTIRVSSFVLID